MIDRKNRYGRTAARIHDADGLARRPSSVTIDIHAHIVVPQAAKLAQPHIDISRIPLAYFSDAASKEINAQQEKDVSEVMTTIDRRLLDLDRMGIDIQVVAPAPGQCYYSIDPKIAEAAHRLANDGVVEYCSRKPDRFVGLGVVTLQEPEIAVRELDYIMNVLKLKGVEILTNVAGQELSDPEIPAVLCQGRATRSVHHDASERVYPWRAPDPFLFQQCSRKPVGYDDCTPQSDFLGNAGALSRTEINGRTRRGLPSRLFGSDRSRLGSPAGFSWRAAFAADDLSAAGLSRHRGFYLSPARLS